MIVNQDTQPVLPNKSLSRALQVLKCFSEETPEWGVSELSRHLGVSKSSVSTILATLASEDLVQQSPTSKRYQLGLGCLALGFLSSIRIPLRDIAFPYLEELLKDNKRIVYLAIPYQDEVIYIEALYPPRRSINFSSLGRRAPIHCTGIGKAMLAFMDEPTIQRVLNNPLPSYTPYSITDRRALYDELERSRARGYALDRQEREEGIHCVAAPIRSTSGNVIAGISVSGSSGEITEALFPEIAKEVIETARSISRKMALSAYGSL